MTASRGRVSSHSRERLVQGWEVCSVPAAHTDDPSQRADIAAGPWIAAPHLAPVAAVLRAAGTWSLDDPPRRFDADDWWYRLAFDVPASGPGETRVLGFDGLATVAQAWLNGEALLASDNMFVAHELNVGTRLHAGRNELVLRFRALDALLLERRARPRWRAPMVENQQLRWFRTTLLGRTPGWSPPAAVVGPWKDIWLERRRAIEVTASHWTTSVEGTNGVVHAAFTVEPLGEHRLVEIVLEAERGGTVCRTVLSRDGASRFSGRLDIADAALWWPHTHGEPALYACRLSVHVAPLDEPITIELGAVGFRTVEIDRSGGRFSLRVNGVPVFCRGACWTPLDPVSLRAAPEAHRRALAQVREAGMNMLRLSGTMVYEDDDFHDACDAAGVLVWQEFMFANMDYPENDAGFIATVRTEVRQQLRRWGHRPSTVVVCGNSEVGQQAAMWGAPRAHWHPALFHETIDCWVRDDCPGLTYWPSSAHGGAFPHQADAGTTSYYGIGAYLRSPDDARRADLSFATECLAFANVPEPSTLARMPGGEALRVHQPAWKSRAPRDLGAGWDFEDVRDHYLAALFGVDPVPLRHSDHDRYLALARVATGEAMAAAFGEWRREGSRCGGALVWFLRDLWAGAGWGVIDDAGVAKACFHYLKRALQPVSLAITDEGVNGLHLHLINEHAQPLAARLDIAAYNDDGAVVANAHQDLKLGPRAVQRVPVAGCFDGFIDLSAAYRFGPPPAAFVEVCLRDAGGDTLARAHHFPAGLPSARGPDPGLTATASRLGERIHVTLRTQRFAQSVHVDLRDHEADDNHFHVAPGGTRTIVLHQVGPCTTWVGQVHALNSRVSASFEVPV